MSSRRCGGGEPNIEVTRDPDWRSSLRASGSATQRERPTRRSARRAYRWARGQQVVEWLYFHPMLLVSHQVRSSENVFSSALHAGCGLENALMELGIGGGEQHETDATHRDELRQQFGDGAEGDVRRRLHRVAEGAGRERREANRGQRFMLGEQERVAVALRQQHIGGLILTVDRP